jgi:hypothetical protein
MGGFPTPSLLYPLCSDCSLKPVFHICEVIQRKHPLPVFLKDLWDLSYLKQMVVLPKKEWKNPERVARCLGVKSVHHRSRSCLPGRKRSWLFPSSIYSRPPCFVGTAHIPGNYKKNNTASTKITGN